MSEEVGWGDTMTFRLWMNMYPHDCPHFTGGDLEAAYNAGVGHATTRATAAERERWAWECKKRARRFRSIDLRVHSPVAVSCANVLESLREDMGKEADGE